MHNKEMVRNTTYFNHTRSTVDKVSTFFYRPQFDCPLKQLFLDTNRTNTCLFTK